MTSSNDEHQWSLMSGHGLYDSSSDWVISVGKCEKICTTPFYIQSHLSYEIYIDHRLLTAHTIINSLPLPTLSLVISSYIFYIFQDFKIWNTLRFTRQSSVSNCFFKHPMNFYSSQYNLNANLSHICISTSNYCLNF